MRRPLEPPAGGPYPLDVEPDVSQCLERSFVWDLPWRVFMAGFQAGLRDGIPIGRAQVEAEEWPVWQQFADHVRQLAKRPGPLTHDEHDAWISQRYARNPALTPDAIREQAARSWSEPPTRARRSDAA